jgi:hypothetical protein
MTPFVPWLAGDTDVGHYRLSDVCELLLGASGRHPLPVPHPHRAGSHLQGLAVLPRPPHRVSRREYGALDFVSRREACRDLGYSPVLTAL